MGGLNMTASSTVERIVALNSLPDLPSRLREAKRLCTHSTTAGAVIRWLLEGLDSDILTRQHPETWLTLSSVFRLVPLGTAATLLSSLDLVETITVALKDVQDVGPLLLAMAGLLGLLLDIAAQPDGISIRLALSVPPASAASFLASWMQAMVTMYPSPSPQEDTDVSEPPTRRPEGMTRDRSMEELAITNAVKLSQKSLLEPAISVWKLRKNSAEINEAFSGACLVPAAFLLTSPKSESAGQTQDTRKRRNDGLPPGGNCDRLLRSLLAKHVLEPSRKAFFEASDISGRHIGSQHPTFAIERMVRPLRRACESHDDAAMAHLALLPDMLDVALANASVSGRPSQRLRERSWIEAVFEALHICNEEGEALREPAVLAKMLRVVREHATSLPQGTLQKVVTQHSKIYTESGQAVNWSLVAEVVAQDLDVFLGPQAAAALFAKLTSVDTMDDELRALMKVEIVIPMMRAFADRGRLMEFADLWSVQLEDAQHKQAWPIWTELTDTFSGVLEDVLPKGHIAELMERFHNAVFQALESDPIPGAKLEASIVVLDAVVSGLHNEDLIDKLNESFGKILETMMRITGASTATNESRRWALITKAFELWFPTWVVQVSDVTAIAEKGLSMLKSDAIKNALAFAASIRQDQDASKSARQAAREAECFIASLCYHACRYGEDIAENHSGRDFEDKCCRVANDLVQQLAPSDLDSLVRYPEMLNAVHKDVRTNLFVHCIREAARTTSDGTQGGSQLQAVASAAVQRAQQPVIDDLVRACLARLEGLDGLEGPDVCASEDSAVLDLLLELPVGCLSRAQREAIIDTVSGIRPDDKYHQEASDTDPPQAGGSQVRIRKRLALLMQLMEVTNATAELSTDAAAVWGLGQVCGKPAQVDCDTAAGNSGRSADLWTLELLGELVALVTRQLLATQEQDRSRSMLMTFSSEAKKQMELIADETDIDGCAAVLTVAKSIICEVEAGSKGSLRAELPRLKPEVVVRLSHVILERTTARLSAFAAEQNSIASTDWLLVGLTTLVSLPGTITNAVYDALSRLLEPVYNVTKDVLSRPEPKALAEENTRPLAIVLVRCYELLCKYPHSGTQADLANLAESLLERQLHPVEYEAVITAFSRRFEGLESTERLNVLEYLFESTERISTSKLMLVEKCIALISKNDIPDVHGLLPHQLLQVLLGVLRESSDPIKCHWATACILRLFKDKPFMTNQHSTETTSAAIVAHLRRGSGSPAYLNACRIMSTMLLQHRSRLRGRSYGVLQALQETMSYLFLNIKPGLQSKRAGKLVRLLTLLCERPQMLRQSKDSNLVDESRAEQARVGQFIHYLIQYYCSQVLQSTVSAAVRDALRPGLWAMIEAMEMFKLDMVEILSAQMNAGERAILRSVYADWKQSKRWRGD